MNNICLRKPPKQNRMEISNLQICHIFDPKILQWHSLSCQRVHYTSEAKEFTILQKLRVKWSESHNLRPWKMNLGVNSTHVYALLDATY
jgi:hypothetical protein